MADNNVLFATSLALIASLVACVDINFPILTATIISHFKTRFNLIRFNQIVESFCLRQRRLKRLQFVLNLVKNDYGFAQREQVPGGTTKRQLRGRPGYCARYGHSKIQNSAKSHRGHGLRMRIS